MKKPTLSTRSRVFVASNKNNAQTSKKDRKSWDGILESPEKSMVICDYSLQKCNKKYLTASSNFSDEEWISDSSWKSISTSESTRNDEINNWGVESFDDSWKSRPNEMELQNNSYNNLDQKHPIRNVYTHTCESITDQVNPMSGDDENKGDESTCDASQPEKKKTRRAGRKHKAQSKQVFEDGSNTDKEKIKYKTELCKNWVEKGKWSYSVRCRFAHGAHELVQPQAEREIEDYKSKPWVVFQEKSYCPYGVRCLFIHEERKISDMSDSYYSKSLLLDEVARNSLEHKRLRVFESLTCCNE